MGATELDGRLLAAAGRVLDARRAGPSASCAARGSGPHAGLRATVGRWPPSAETGSSGCGLRGGEKHRPAHEARPLGHFARVRTGRPGAGVSQRRRGGDLWEIATPPSINRDFECAHWRAPVQHTCVVSRQGAKRRGHIGRGVQAKVRSALRSGTPTQGAHFRQPASDTSTGSSTGPCDAAVLAPFCQKASPSCAGCLGLTDLLHFCHPQPLSAYREDKRWGVTSARRQAGAR
jgi:hypothetical protein